MTAILTDRPAHSPIDPPPTHAQIDQSFDVILATERARLVRLCTTVLGDAAEDVVQEALLEAWRNVDKLRDPAALPAWLSGIARNVCARWLRKQGKQVPRDEAPAHAQTENLIMQVAADVDLELTLERDELALLLDRALALLPPATRDVLVQKFVADLPYAAIADELGLSENAVAARVHRGKLALKKLLHTELRNEAETFGLVHADDVWRATRIWCTQCGKQRMMGRLDGKEFALRCPACNTEENSYHSQDNIIDYSGFKTFRPALNHFNRQMHTFFERAIYARGASCRFCGEWLPLRKGFPPYAPPSIQGRRGLHVYCTRCHTGSYASIYGQAMFYPRGRDFWRQEQRILTRPAQEIEAAGVPALRIPFESVRSSAKLDIIVRRDTYDLLAIHSSERA